MNDRLHALTLGDVLREQRRSYPLQTAAVCGASRLTYPDLDDRATRLANGLASRGVAHGDRIVWIGQNCHRVLESLLAAAKLGAVLCPVNWRQSPAELAFVLRDTGPAAVIWQHAEIGDAVVAARQEAAIDAIWIQHDDEAGYEALLAGSPPHDPDLLVDGDAPVLQLYTAAFAGRPNGALISHAAVILQGLVVGPLQDIDSRYVYLNSGPLFHVFTLTTTLATFLFGGTNVFTPRADPEELCRLIDAERCTGAFLMPPTINQIVELNSDKRYDLSSLRTFGGSPEWRAMIGEDTSRWGRRPAGYGQTEVMGVLTYSALGGAGAHGRPPPTVQVRIVDPDGREVAAGETGEIVARGPIVMRGYHARDDENVSRSAGGWHHTGDLGRREEDGSVTFIGPKTRIIKSAAENIYPAEVEACIASHPDVKECAVIGVPDPTWTQNVKAVVVLHDGRSLRAEEVVEHCRERIASYKKPKSVEFVDALPRAGFAVDYDALDLRFGGGGYPGRG